MIWMLISVDVHFLNIVSSLRGYCVELFGFCPYVDREETIA